MWELFERQQSTLALRVNPGGRHSVRAHAAAHKQDHVFRGVCVQRHSQCFVQLGLAHGHPKIFVFNTQIIQWIVR